MFASSAPPDVKSALRAQFAAYRRSLSPDEHQRRSAAIVARALDTEEIQAAGTVHAYWPLMDRGEIDTRPLIRTLHDRGVQVVLPVVTDFSGGPGAMAHRRYTGPEALAANRWGILEPDGTARVDPEALDLVLVPALGAGRNGHRIGHGAGFYDAFLQPLSVPRLALVYDRCLVNAVPGEPHDVPMTGIVTESSVIRPSAP